MTEPSKPTLSILSRKRLSQIREAILLHAGPTHMDDLMQDVCDIMKFDPTPKVKQTMSVLTQTRLKQILSKVEQRHGHEPVDAISASICEIMKFDPNYSKGRYTTQNATIQRTYRQRKAAATGATQYDLFAKKYYHPTA